MNEKRKLALRKESLSELASHELHRVAGGYEIRDSLGCILKTVVACGDLLTVATCTCPTGATCVCPTQGGAGCF